MSMPLPVTRKLDFTEIPVVDIGPLGEADNRRIPVVAAEIARACQDVGFMYVKNHGVSAIALCNLRREAEVFFSLPSVEKMKVAVEISPQYRGYLPLEYTGEEGEEGRNLQEGFIMMPDRPVGTLPLHGPNQWPENVPGLKAAMMAYFVEVEKLARLMLPGFASGVGLPGDYFRDAFRDPEMMILKLNHYPPQKAMNDAYMLGVGGHTDFSAFTILWQDDLGGLEVLNKSGEWVGVPPIEDTFVINIGDLMQVWTNGRFSSTEHRVINRYGKDRNSIAFFVDPVYSTKVEPLVDRSGNYEPVVSGDHIYAQFRRIYPQRKY